MMSDEDPGFSLTTGRVRKLAAILSADVEGYSRLMGEDESATVQTLTVYRAVIETFVQQHRGRVVDSPGDNVLAEFASVVDAVQCAVAVQEELNARNAVLPLPRRMKFRVGINLGDVIVDGPRIYGDGVNMAARLEGLAEGGGICIAGSVYEQIKTKLALGYEDMGTQAFKNIAEPVRAYRVRPGRGAAMPPARRWKSRVVLSGRQGALVAAALLVLLVGAIGVWQWLSHRGSPLPEKPSIAVLPFVNMSGDSEQEYFSDGMTEDLITELSRLSGMFVIARNSVYAYKGKAVRPEQVRRELGVRYLLEGSVRKADNRIRITAQLVDAETGYHMWAQNYDRNLQDIFAVQEEMARTITRALAVRLTMEEEKLMGRPYTSSENAWESFMRGTELYRKFTPTDNAKAREYFEKAIREAPNFSRAYASLSATHRQDASLGWTPNREASNGLAYSNAEKAVSLANSEPDPKPSLPHALEQWGYVLLYRREHEAAIAAAEQAVRLNPNYADGYALWAHVLIFSGKPEEALRKTQDAITRNPKYPFFYDYHRGHAHYVLGFWSTDSKAKRKHFEDAEKHLRESLKKNGNFRPARAYLVAVLSELGRQSEAKKEMKTLEKTVGRPQALQNPQSFEEFVKPNIPYQNPAIMARLLELWRRASQP